MTRFAFLDITADRFRAWQRGPASLPIPIKLDHDRDTLPLAIRGDQRKWQIGHAALQISRQCPHLFWAGFLNGLNEPKTMTLGRHRIAPDEAIQLHLQQIKECLGSCRQLLMAVPAYLQPSQVDRLEQMARDLGWDLLGIIPRGLLIAQAIHEEEQPWKELGVLADVDDAGLSLHVIRPSMHDLHLVQERHLPLLGRLRWLDCLIDAAATASIHLHRRDPRSDPHSDQEIFDQAQGWLRQLQQGKEITIRFTPTHRTLPYELTLRRAQAENMCLSLCQRAAMEWLHLLKQVDPKLTHGSLRCSKEVAELPGLLSFVQSLVKARLDVCIAEDSYPAMALRLADSISRKERHRIAYATKCISLPDAEFIFDARTTGLKKNTTVSEPEFTFDAPHTLPFPQEPWLIKKPMAEPLPDSDLRQLPKRQRPAQDE